MRPGSSGLGDLPDWFEPDQLPPPPAPAPPPGRSSLKLLIFAAACLVITTGILAVAFARAPTSEPAHREAQPSPSSATQPAETPSEQPSAPVTPGLSLASDALATLTVKGRAASKGFEREAFGQPWFDEDGNGCDTRNDILRRDLTAVEIKPNSNGCAVLAGMLRDPFTGNTIPFERGWNSSGRVQIDHVVALSDAWQKGAHAWTNRTRRAFANDPLELLAVDGPENMSKSDGDAATWLPPNKSFRCSYVARQVAVKKKYDLSVTPAEQAAMSRVLSACPSQSLPTSQPIPLGN